MGVRFSDEKKFQIFGKFSEIFGARPSEEIFGFSGIFGGDFRGQALRKENNQKYHNFLTIHLAGCFSVFYPMTGCPSCGLRQTLGNEGATE